MISPRHQHVADGGQWWAFLGGGCRHRKQLEVLLHVEENEAILDECPMEVKE